MAEEPASRLMRIVAHNGARLWGGAERATVALLHGLQGRGHDVVLLCNDELVRANAAATGVSAELCPIGGDVALHDAFRLARRLRRIEPDAFIVGTWKKLFLAGLGARLAGVPRTVARIGLETDTPRNLKYRIALTRWCDGVVVNSRRLQELFLALPFVRPQFVRLIHNGVAPYRSGDTRDEVRAELGIPRDAIVIGTVARLARQKRIDRLLEGVAMARADITCVIVGDGSEMESLRTQSAQPGLTGRVRFTGEREDTARLLSAFDIYLVTSDREGLSNSMLEAMSAGLPVITTPVSGSEDAVGGVPSAGIITAFDPGSIAEAIDLLAGNADLRTRLGRASRSRAESTFSFGTMLDGWEEFLKSGGNPSMVG